MSDKLQLVVLISETLEPLPRSVPDRQAEELLSRLTKFSLRYLSVLCGSAVKTNATPPKPQSLDLGLVRVISCDFVVRFPRSNQSIHKITRNNTNISGYAETN